MTKILHPIIYHLIVTIVYLVTLSIHMPYKLYVSTAASPLLVPIVYMSITAIISRKYKKENESYARSLMITGIYFSVLVFIIVSLFYSMFG